MAADSSPDPAPRRSADAARPGRRRTGLIVAGVIVVAVVLWLILRGDDDNDSAKQATLPAQRQPGLPPVVLNQASLKSFASGQGAPLYWVGPVPNRAYEVTRTGDGSVYIRYLPIGVKPGDPRPSYLTIGSYPNGNALQAVRQAGSESGNTIAKVPGAAEAVVNTKKAQNGTYMAFEKNPKVLVEVWDPRPGRSLQLIRAGAVVPVR